MDTTSYVNTRITKPEVAGIAPLFIVNSVPAALAFYRDYLGFTITFQGPEPDDIFFGIVRRGAAMIMFKDVGVGLRNQSRIPMMVCVDSNSRTLTAMFCSSVVSVRDTRIVASSLGGTDRQSSAKGY